MGCTVSLRRAFPTLGVADCPRLSIMRFLAVSPGSAGVVAVGPLASGLFAFGQEATGFFAFGQEATGFVAIGQVATGVVAVGQLARGGIVVGQLAIGLAAIGQLAIGVFWAGGIGIGGTSGFGLVYGLFGRFRLASLATARRRLWHRLRRIPEDSPPRTATRIWRSALAGAGTAMLGAGWWFTSGQALLNTIH
jgi:hypothetical protein